MDFKNLTLPIKQMLGYLIGILLLTILFSLSITHLSTIATDYNSTMRIAWRHLNALQDLRAYGLQVMLDIDSNPVRAKRELDLMVDTFNVLIRSGVSGLPRDLTLVVKDLLSLRQQGFKLIKLKENEAALAEVAAQRAVFTNKYHLFMSRIYVEIEKSKSNVAVSETSYLQRISYLLLLNTVLAPLSFAFLYIYGFFLSNYTGLRLKKFLDSFNKILSGNYKEKIADDSRDEIGQIAQGVNELAERLDKGQ